MASRVTALKAKFDALDAEKNGGLSVDQLHQGLLQSAVDCPRDLVESLVERFDIEPFADFSAK